MLRVVAAFAGALLAAAALVVPPASARREPPDPVTRARSTLAYLQQRGLPVLIEAPRGGKLVLRAGPSEGARVVYSGPAEAAQCGEPDAAASLRQIRLTGMVPGWYRVRVARRLGWLPAASVEPVDRLERRTLDGQLVAALPINDSIEVGGRSPDGNVVYMRYRDPDAPRRRAWLALHLGRGDYFRLASADAIRRLAGREALAVRLAGPNAADPSRRAAAGGRLYVIRGGDEPALLVADEESGRVVRTYPLPARPGRTGGPGSLVVAGETVLVAGLDYPTFALDLDSGEARKVAGPARLLRLGRDDIALLPTDGSEPLRYHAPTGEAAPLDEASIQGALVEPPDRLAPGSGPAGLLVIVRRGC